MKNNPQDVAPAGPDRADPVPHRASDVSALPLDGPFMNGKDNEVSQIRLAYGHSGLLPGPVFDEHEFAALKLPSIPAEHDHGLQGEERRSIDVPVQTIEISGVIPEKQGRGLGLPLAATFFLKGRKGGGVSLGAVQPVHHPVGNGGEMRIQVSPQMRN